MNWILIIVFYTVTLDNVPHQALVEKQEFGTEALCETARAKVEEQLKTRAITAKASCVQISE